VRRASEGRRWWETEASALRSWTEPLQDGIPRSNDSRSTSHQLQRAPFTQEKKVQHACHFCSKKLYSRLQEEIGTGSTKRGYSRLQSFKLHLLGIDLIRAFLGQTGESGNDLRNPSDNLGRFDGDPLHTTCQRSEDTRAGSVEKNTYLQPVAVASQVELAEVEVLDHFPPTANGPHPT